MAFLDFPFQFDGRGRSRAADRDDHVRDLIHQVLFTSPGERVNRPEFGCALRNVYRECLAHFGFVFCGNGAGADTQNN